jgi:hypothetical protein
VKRAISLLVAALVGAAMLVMMPGAADAAAPNTFFSFSSDPGDYIGGGQQTSYSPPTSEITLTGNNSFARVSVEPATGGWWDIEFAAPAGQRLRPGVYTNAERYPFNEGTHPGLSVHGMGRGCNTLTGTFTIFVLSTGEDGRLDELWANFEQHCEGGGPAMRGIVQVNSPDPAAINFSSANRETVEGQPLELTAEVVTATSVPVTFKAGDTVLGTAPIGADRRARLVTSALPAGTHSLTASVPGQTSRAITQNVLANDQSWWFSSSARDWPGGGYTRAFAVPDRPLVSNLDPSYFTISFFDPADSSFFSIDLAAPPGERLHAGAYENAQRAAFRDPGRPGIDIGGDGRGCNTIAGRFVVHDIELTAAGQVKLLDATFEQHCEGGGPALVGGVHWTEPDVPVPGAPTKTNLSAPHSVKNGKAAKLTAQVRNVKGASKDAVTGTVTFTDGGTVLGTADLNNKGKATLSVNLAPGRHSITAIYNGDDDSHEASTSKPVRVTAT